MDLDALSAILGALAAGAGHGAVDAIKDSAKMAITASRDKMVELIRRRLGDDRLGKAKLDVYTLEPNPTAAEALSGHLLDSGVDNDPAITVLAREILAAAGPSATGPGSVVAGVITQINRDNSTGFVGGNHVHYRSNARATASWDIATLGSGRFELRNIGTAEAVDLTIVGTIDLGFPSPPRLGWAWDRQSSSIASRHLRIERLG